MTTNPEAIAASIYAGAYLYRLANPQPIDRDMTYLQRAARAIDDADACVSTFAAALELRARPIAEEAGE